MSAVGHGGLREIPVSDIKVGSRHRKDMGDLAALAESIRQEGLLQPVGVTTPFNLLPVPAGGTSATSNGHPATTPYDVAAWWVKYLLPPEGVLLDPFCGSGTMLAAGLDFGASQVIGVEKEGKYLGIARNRIAGLGLPNKE